VTTRDPVVPGDGAARLEELAEVTRTYASYSRTAFGLAHTVPGAVALVAVALARLGNSWGSTLLALTPLVWLVTLWALRSWYQRHGLVIEQDPLLPGLSRAARWLSLSVTTVLSVFLVLGCWRDGRLLGAATALAVPPIGLRVARGRADLEATTYVTAVAAFGAPYLARGAGIEAAVLASLALIWVLGGVWQHLQYRRLERRLAALKRGFA
jgi:hypothetical protein